MTDKEQKHIFIERFSSFLLVTVKILELHTLCVVSLDEFAIEIVELLHLTFFEVVESVLKLDLNLA